MSSVMKHPKTRLDWYEEVCQRLDALKQSMVKYADEGDKLPSCQLFEVAKQTVTDLRRLADFPNLSTPDVWLGPNGEIGVTWESGNRSLELLFCDSGVLARLSVESDEHVLEPKAVPVELKKFAA